VRDACALSKRLLQVGNQVVDALNANEKPERVFRNTRFFSSPRRKTGDGSWRPDGKQSGTGLRALSKMIVFATFLRAGIHVVHFHSEAGEPRPERATAIERRDAGSRSCFSGMGKRNVSCWRANLYG
jgi:hypothetical protein